MTDPPVSAFPQEMDALRMGLVEMASVVLSQVERSVVAWEEHDPGAAAEVIAGDEIVDDRCLQLDQEIFGIHIKHAPVAGDLRLMHVGLIAAIALERVGDLAVSIARLAGSVPHEGAVASVQSLIQRMSARAVDTLAQAVQAIARGDIALGEQARDDAQGVQAMLDQVIVAAAQGPDSPETRTWQAAAVLVARHLERVANNAAELGGRVRFLVAGEPFRRARDLEPVSESTG